MATLCMALRHGEDVHLLTDRMITDEGVGYRFKSALPKIIPLGERNGADVVAMAAGTIVINTILRSKNWSFDRAEDDNDSRDEFEARLATKFLPDLLATHRELNYGMNGEAEGDLTAEWPMIMGPMLIVYNGGIYNVCNKRSIMDMGDCGAIGSSERIVYPSIKTAQHFTSDPVEQLIATLNTCIDLDPYVCAPFDYAVYRNGRLGSIQSIETPEALRS